MLVSKCKIPRYEITHFKVFLPLRLFCCVVGPGGISFLTAKVSKLGNHLFAFLQCVHIHRITKTILRNRVQPYSKTGTSENFILLHTIRKTTETLGIPNALNYQCCDVGILHSTNFWIIGKEKFSISSKITIHS